MRTVNTKRKLSCIFGIVAVAAGTCWLAVAPAFAADDPVYVVTGTAPEAEETAYLGVQLREETEHPEGGARVTHVVDDSPADEAGIRKGDIIVGFGGEVIRGPVGLTQRIHARDPGDTVSVTVIRDGASRKLDVELGHRPDPLGIARMTLPEVYSMTEDSEEWKEALEDYKERMGELGERLGRRYGTETWSAPFFSWSFRAGKPKLGVQLVETTPELREHLGGDEDEGVLVSKVLSGTPAESAGISVGDLIVSVDGESVASAGELVEALADKDGKTFPIVVVRDGREVTLEVTVEEPEDPVPTGPRAYLRPPVPLAAPEVPRVPTALEGIHVAPVAPAPRVPPAAPAPPAPPQRVSTRVLTTV